MVWGGSSWRGKAQLAFVNGTMDALAYTTMSEQTLELFIDEYYPGRMTFQPDGAPVSRAKSTLEYFFELDIPVLDWASHSSDMNVFKNCWGFLSQSVYKAGRQFETVNDLREALVYEWEKLPLEYVRTQIYSMKHRVRHLWKCDGRETKY